MNLNYWPVWRRIRTPSAVLGAAGGLLAITVAGTVAIRALNEVLALDGVTN
jgi:hypothetical protein